MIPDYKENKVLRTIAKEIEVEDIKSKNIQAIIRKMKSELQKESDGVAIAAPQIKEDVRIFVVSGKVFNPDLDKNKELNTEEIPDQCFINPKIIKLSKKTKELPEGCLSVRWLYGKVKRHTNITIESYDENGQKTVRGAGGLLAQIFQHEIDHLNGVLFIDKAKDVENLPPEK